MALSLLFHRPSGTGDAAEEMRTAVRDAVWEVAEAHWVLGEEAVLVSSDLSAEYLRDHFRRALGRRGHAETGLLLVTSVGPQAAWAGLPQEAEAWLHDALR
jgi:hypothetical protein